MSKLRAKNRDMSGLEIRFQLMKKRVKLSVVAARAGVSPSAVTRMLDDNDIYQGRNIRPYIAEALGLPEEKIWPSAEKRKHA